MMRLIFPFSSEYMKMTNQQRLLQTFQVMLAIPS
jgi:hypothetical protein